MHRASVDGPGSQHSRVVWLRYGEDWALDAIATEIGRSPGATKQTLHRAIKALRARLAADIASPVPFIR